MAINRHSRTKYFKQFTFSIDFDISQTTKALFVERQDDLSLLAQMLVLAEMRKPVPFADVSLHHLRPKKYTEAAFESEGLKVLQLIRNLCAGRKDFPMHWLWLYKYRAGFNDDDAKLIEQCLYNLLERDMIEVTSYEHSFSAKGKETLMVKPKLFVKKYDQKYELINANATIERYKKGKL